MTAKLLRISAKDFVSVIKQIFPKTLTLISKAPEGITDLVNHFLQNKREVEIRSRFISLEKEDRIPPIKKNATQFPEMKKKSKNYF